MKRKSASIIREKPVLTSIQEAAALAIASGFTLDEAGRKIGFGTQTIKTWLQQIPEFGRRIQETRDEKKQCVMALLIDRMSAAVNTLDELSREGKNESVRLSAAKLILELGTKVQQSVEFHKQITVLQVSQQQDCGCHESQLNVLTETTRSTQDAT
jgi:hypothetical protein